MKFFKILLFFSIITFFSCGDAEISGYVVTDYYIPCGWMGCGTQGADLISLDENWEENPHSGKDCFRLSFKNCDEPATGIYWVNNQVKGACNWGDVPGNDYSTEGYSKLSFWARGESGEERIKFGIGGINKSTKLYQDSLDEFQFVNLTKNWKKYTISLKDQKLHSVIGGFYWYATKADNPTGGTFYVDDVEYK